jgi:PhzF family phenazine biosynthesis protein
MIRRAIRHVDAFTATPLEGNPAAVVDGDGLTTETMQRIALNQKLSETVFLLPPTSGEDHALLRIFTPGREIPFAGHPTVAVAHILFTEQRVTIAPGEAMRLETGAGVIPVHAAGDPPRYTMTQATPRFREASVDAETVAGCLGLEAADVVHVEYVSTGLEWLLARIGTLEAMMRVQPDMERLRAFDLAVFCVGAEAPDADIHVRAFAPGAGVFEDPVTGSANGCIGALVARDGLIPPRDRAVSYVAEQGGEMGQPGRVYVRATGAPGALTVEVGGHAVTVLRGELLLP